MRASVWIFLSVVALGSGCSREEEERRLQERLTVVRQELETSRRDVEILLEIGVLLDSIDRNRYDVLVDWRKRPTPFNQYKYRLRAIRDYVADTETRIKFLEEQIDRVGQPSPESLQLISRLKERIRRTNQELQRLKAQLSKYTLENQALFQRVSQQDLEFDERESRLREQEQILDRLNVRVQAAVEAYQSMQADACYGEAQALEALANRTRFAAAKKRETLLQALDLYRLSLRFGNEDARPRILELERMLE